VDEHPPLGGYDQFRRSRGGPFSWGEGGRSRISYGIDVLPDLIQGLRELPALAKEDMPTKAEAQPVVIGCVYRLTSDEVVDALLPLDTCIVVDRTQNKRATVDRLHREGRPLTTLYLPGFHDVARPLPNGRRPVIGPGSPPPEPLALGPARAAGWWSPGPRRPLVHAKMLIAGRSWVWEDDWGQEQWHLMLVHLPDGYKPEQVTPALAEKVKTLPEVLRRSLTWDQGAEMRDWERVRVDADIDIYFCDPHSPWQRGTTRTPTACCASTSRKAPTCRCTAKLISTGSLPSSTTGPASG
jgi:hypothetical protein